VTAAERADIHATVAMASRRLYGEESIGRPAFKKDRTRDIRLNHRVGVPLFATLSLGVQVAERPED